jgi:hypothetical protein
MYEYQSLYTTHHVGLVSLEVHVDAAGIYCEVSGQRGAWHNILLNVMFYCGGEEHKEGASVEERSKRKEQV